MPPKDTLDYGAIVDNAMRGVVRDVLRQVEQTGLPGQHHFFISFSTRYPGVSMSEGLRARYPQEITIVLQHQFWDLKVSQEKFQVALSFNNIPEKLVVPFAALLGFADPSTKFGLQFHSGVEAAGDETETVAAVPASIVVAKEEQTSKVITLDAFRKK